MMNNTVKKALVPFVNDILGRCGRWASRDYDIENTIVLSGVPRGGTTWVYEMLLSTIPLSCGIWEPLFLYNDSRLRRLKFSWREYIDPAREWREAETLFRDILTGQNISLSLIHNHSVLDFLRKMARSERYVVKFCRANRLLGWLVAKIGVKTPILLIRHPCAVVASQMTQGGWNHVLNDTEVEHPEVSMEFVRKESWITEILNDIRTPEEKLAATWCLDYYIPLSEAKPHPWVLICYERMVADGASEGTRLFEALGQEVPKDLERHLFRPSSTTQRGSNVLFGRDRLATWKERLSQEQEENILSVVSRFGLDFYTGRLEPDYERLYGNPIRKGFFHQ
jgi:hypothetical protein